VIRPLVHAAAGFRPTDRGPLLCVNGYAAGVQPQQYTRIAMLRSATEARVQVIPHARLFGADDDTVYLVNTLTGEPIILDGVDGLVLALGHQQNDMLYWALGVIRYRVRRRR
jgi:hypothetical protein